MRYNPATDCLTNRSIVIDVSKNLINRVAIGLSSLQLCNPILHSVSDKKVDPSTGTGKLLCHQTKRRPKDIRDAVGNYDFKCALFHRYFPWPVALRSWGLGTGIT